MSARVRSEWAGLLAVCAKCEKRLGQGGFGAHGDRRLSKVLAKAAGGKGRKARFGVVPSKCLKLCPRGGVTVVSGTRPRDWLIVRPGETADAVLAWAGIGPMAEEPKVVVDLTGS